MSVVVEAHSKRCKAMRPYKPARNGGVPKNLPDARPKRCWYKRVRSVRTRVTVHCVLYFPPDMTLEL